MTPYQFSSNQPIHAPELEGCENMNDLNYFTDPALAKFREKYTPKENKENQKAFNDGFIRGLAAGAPLVLLGIAAPEIGPAYGAYCAWFSTSAPAWYTGLSTISLGTVGEGGAWCMFAKSSTNLFGQLAFNEFKFDKEINFWQPVPAAFTGGIFGNSLESMFELRYSFDKDKTWSFDSSSPVEFTSSFIGNVAGGKVSDKFDNFVKPITNFSMSTKPIFDLYGGTIIESSENVLSKKVENDLNSQFASPAAQSKDKSTTKKSTP